jgi:sugar transferase (PEP-CTERM/EpsH1 system associated)
VAAGRVDETLGLHVKVLCVVTRLPVPPWRGDQVRAYHHLRRLAARHDITCCALLAGEPPAALRDEVASLGVRLEVVPLGTVGAVPALARALLGDRRPLQVLLYERGPARRRVAALIAAGGFDVVHAQLVRTAPYLPGPDGPPVVLDLIDALSANLARRASQERGPLAPVAAWEATRLARFERELIERTARSLVVSAAERDALGGGPRIAVVPNGVDTDAFAYHDGPRPPGRLLFFGNLGYFPNIDAVRWLVSDIFPRVRAAVPEAELRLVGARPARAVRALARAPGISLAAEVPAMAPEVAAATVALVPMRAGTGLQNKVLEAMAAGTPVVATPPAIAALDVRPGEHLLVGEDAAAVAAATVALLRDPARARALAVAARALVEQHHSWEDSARGVEAAWDAAVSGRRR